MRCDITTSMKAESLSSSRNSRQQAFYAYRRKASPSPSVCSSASSSAVSTGHNSASSRSSITRNIIAQKKRALSYQGSSSSTSTAHNYSYVSSASSAYFNSSSATNASTAASSVMGSAAILDAHAQALKSELDKRRDSLPSSSTGSNKEFDALIEREYQEEILTYMAEMEVCLINHGRLVLPGVHGHHADLSNLLLPLFLPLAEPPVTTPNRNRPERPSS